MRTVLALILSLVAAVPACSSSGTGELDTERMQWSRLGLESYSFTWEQSCFCDVNRTRPIRITVTAGSIASAVYINDQTAVAEPVRGALTTIDGMFDLIQDQIDSGAARVDVTYDPTRSYPASVSIDRIANAADDELSYTISDVATP